MTGQSRRAENRAEEHLVQLSLIDPYHRNHGLFSNHYLDERVSEDPFWKALAAQVVDLRQAVIQIWNETSEAQKQNASEAELEHSLVRPILDVLGHFYNLQQTLQAGPAETTKIPDYIFFPSDEAKKAAGEARNQASALKQALAVGDAKAWSISLDRKIGDGFNMQSPSYQIDYYIRHAGAPWGILTNGRLWRLYHRDTSYRLDTYYEVDLEQLIAQTNDSGAQENFLYFAAFFHKDALVPDPSTGECFLDRALKGSAQYAKGIGDKLKGNVYEVLRLLCEGFLSLPSNGLTHADMAAIRENGFVVIYRLLFILYAEARGFLPLRNSGYATGSLVTLAHDIAGKALDHLSTRQTNYWDRLQNLFDVIDHGDESVGVHPYNGGLFSNEGEHNALTRWKISDRYAAQAIDLLARVQEQPGRPVFVDYRDLSVRELGTIYEGLLEQQPRYAEVDTAIVKQDKREIYVPVNKLKNSSNLPIVHQGSVYLATDKGERKITGSYYTPDYIVKYIVSHALDPLLEEAKQANPDGGQKLADAILSLKVLDPAMGSGHFLVEATDYLARAYAEAMAPSDHETGEEDIRLARRRVVERCVYGVDLNPLAVELAKLSLWLYTVSENKPLNFLDHHLRCGNSLIGTEIESLGVTKQPSKRSVHEAPRRDTALFTSVMQQSLASAVGNYIQIETMSSDLLDQVKQKEQLFTAAREALERYRQTADIWTSIPFGNTLAGDEYGSLQLGADLAGSAWSDFEAKPWFVQAMTLAQRQRFFHWELEFPEVFYDEQGQRKGNPGFDAVIGNPPYEVLASKENRNANVQVLIDFFSRSFAVAAGKQNLYRLMIEKAYGLLRQGAWFGFIVPATVLADESATPTRKLILENSSELTFNVFPESAHVFEGVTQAVCIIVTQRGANLERVSLATGLTGPNDLGNQKPVHISKEMLRLLDPDNFDIPAVSPSEWELLKKIHGWPSLVSKDSAESLCDIYQGEVNLTVFRNCLSAENTGALLVRGNHVQRYYVRLTRAPGEEGWLDKAQYMALARTSKKAQHYLQERLAFQEVANMELQRRLNCAPIAPGVFLAHTVNYLCNMKGNPHYLLAILNSRLLNWRFKATSTNNHVSGHEIGQLPVRRIAFTTPEQQRGGLVEQGKRFYAEYLTSGDSGSFLAFIDQRLPQNPDGAPDIQNEQSDVVHDLLAFFAGEMTRLHKEEQAEAQVFLDWLQRYVRVPIDQLAGKTTVGNYWEPQAGRDALITVLVKNRKVIQRANGPDVTSVAVQAKITQECDPAIQKLRGIERQIALTDRLIDQTVYRLYGLTPEEIAAVEA